MKTEIKNFYSFSDKLSSNTFQAHPIGLTYEKNENNIDDIIGVRPNWGQA